MKRKGKVVKVAAAALTTALAGLLIPLATASSASAAKGDCPSGAFCVWEHGNFEGVILVPSVNGDSWPDFSSRSFDNLASSAVNWTSQRWCLYAGPNYQDRIAVFNPSTSLQFFPSSANDRASSAKVC